MKNQQLVSKLRTFLGKKDNLLILILTGVLLLVIAWPVEKSGKPTSKSAAEATKRSSTTMDNGAGTGTVFSETENRSDLSDTTVEALERRLEELLSLVQGVGKVRVMITLQSSAETIVEKDSPVSRSNIVENDAQGGSRSTNEMDAEETTVYVTNGAGEKIPYVVKSLSPVIEGVSVVAEGGGNPLVQKNVTEMIQALFNLPVHKIAVVKMKEQN